jgi:predicted aspartyl protease
MKGMCLFLAGLCLLSGSLITFCLALDDDTIAEKPHSTAFAQAPLILYRSYVLTKVSVNGGKEQTFLVDNGCVHTSVHPRTIGKGRFTKLTEHAYKTINKKQLVDEYGVIPSLRIGGLEIADHKVRSTEVVGLLSRQLQRKIYGILGFETLRDYLTVFDFESETIYFISNTTQNVESLRALDGVVRCPFEESQFGGHNVHLFSIEILINGRPVKAFLDLGYPGAVLTTVDHTELDLFVSASGRKEDVALLGQKGWTYPTKAKEVTIGGYSVSNVEMLYMPLEGGPELTLLGVGFIKNFTFSIDYANKEIYLGPRSEEVSSSCLAFLTGRETVD